MLNCEECHATYRYSRIIAHTVKRKAKLAA